MKIKLSDFVAKVIVEEGVTHLFSVVGGGSMHLNDSFGHQEGLQSVYCHHEQACAIAAEAYARVENRLAAVCVTTGPGGINALNGVCGAYVDSIPMLVISGQVKRETTVRASGLPVRCVGDQEFDIVPAVAHMTKYAVMITEPETVYYHLKRAIHIARSGRPGPVWLDIPTDVQSSFIDTDTLQGYDEREDDALLPPPVSDETVQEVISLVSSAKRPVLYAGSAIRYAGVREEFLALVEKWHIPVVTAWNSIDVIWDEHPDYVGRGGMMGDRAGNFAVQNADLVLSIGCRLSIRQVGYSYRTWAREAKVIMVDVDQNELKKPTIHVEYPVWADLKDFLPKLARAATPRKESEWSKVCRGWKERYPVIREEMCSPQTPANPYCFLRELSKQLADDELIVVGNGTACVAGSHGLPMKRDQRFFIQSGMASMGYDLPAAVGVAKAASRDRIVLITGDGSIQMNLQELQTILTHRLPVKIFLLNNGGYQSIR
ncbi:MAG: thiamine pyrophosphate-binding protein, partial [Christensenellaceae bacterium]